jgi:ABC-2 type transport system ATP-binding protein
MTAAVEIRGINKAFGRFPAVSDLSFSVPPGVIFGLLGPNGAGKTTTIRMIMGITLPDSGEIRVHGAPMDRATQNRIGYLPEERGLYRKMKVIDHLLFLADIKEVPRAKAKERIGTWLDKMELRPWLKKKVDELSKGMQQKLQFIATIVHDPEILILDEPFSGLDPINAALVKEYLIDFRARGKTIIFSTHVLEQAEKLCDEICLLARSKKILEGSVRDLKKRYTQDQIRISTSAGLADVAQVPGVATAAGDGRDGYVVTLSPGTDHRAVLRAALDRFPVDAFSQKEPELEEIYLEAVRAAGMEETRPIE